MTTDFVTPAQRGTLVATLDTMIPPSDEYRVPGAGDDLVVQEILKTAGDKLASYPAAYAALEAAAGSLAFADLSTEERLRILESTQEAHSAFFHLLTVVAIQCYYRDVRVMESLGMEARPPFPQGFEVEQGDWTLLDPVRKREKFYRKA